ncbi:MAG: glycosyltransferase [Candidatus Lokiarchaeota archaeon]|nr:glycosyltransferase [Candidatus Lokiarchaeota archaeon]
MVRDRLQIGMFSAMYSQMNGSAHAVRFLSEALAELGHDVHVFAPRIENGEDKPDHIHYHDLGGARVAKKTGFVLSVPLHKIFNCDYSDLDIAHIQTHASIGALGINWSKMLGLPMVGSHHSPMTFYAAQYVPIIGRILSKNDLIWRYERLVMEKYDLCHVPTKTKKELLMNYRFKEPIVALSNGIRDYYFKEMKENGIREKYGIDGKKVLLYASRLSPEKHPIQVIKTFSKIHKRIPDSHLLLVGSEGPSTEKVQKIVNKRKYRNYVSYAGRVPFNDLLRLYNAADVTCLWSWVEAEGLVLLEAMAQGTPNVGANGSGIANVIRHGKTGYLANNLKEFEDYVVKILDDDDLRAQMGKNAKEVAEEHRIEKVAQNWVQLYNFTKDELFPLRYYRKERRKRVELTKNFIKDLPNVYF